MSKKLRVGVLALQGSFREHVEMLERLNMEQDCYEVQVLEIRLPAHIDNNDLDSLILPGGESTTMGKLAKEYKLLNPLREWVHSKKGSVWGTCAGMIMLCDSAIHTEQGGQALIGGINAQVSRNFFGAQISSFEKLIDGPPNRKDSLYNAIFIRAPAITSIDKDDQVQVLARLENVKSAEQLHVSEVVIAARKV